MLNNQDFGNIFLFEIHNVSSLYLEKTLDPSQKKNHLSLTLKRMEKMADIKYTFLLIITYSLFKSLYFDPGLK